MRCKRKSARCAGDWVIRRRYADSMININEHLDALPVAKESEKNSETELNEIILNSMTNVLSKKAYVQGFDCEYIT